MDVAAVKAKLTHLVTTGLPIAVTVGSTAVTGTRTPGKRRIDLMVEGSAPSDIGAVVVVADQLTAIPVAGSEITVGGTIFRVVDTELDSAGAALTINYCGRYE